MNHEQTDRELEQLLVKAAMTVGKAFADAEKLLPDRLRSQTVKENAMKHALALLGLVLLAQAQQSDIRFDTYDTHSNRTGYIIVNPNTGRIDQFDARSNRLGYGTTTTTPYGTRIDTFTPNGTRAGSGTLPTTPRR